MRNIFIFLILLGIGVVNGQEVEEKFRINETYAHSELIDAYQDLDRKYKKARLVESGMTDSGRPLHLFILSEDKKFEPKNIDHEKNLVYMINNAIHPGEPCGVDASLKMAEELLRTDALESGVVVLIIPMYNIGGALHRGCCSRANQNGPEAYGFRGNSRNLDLNRDFMKCDSKNAISFTKIFNDWKPDVFIDTHTTNGADYPYVLTLISSQFDKAEPMVAQYTQDVVEPFLYNHMRKSSFPMSPYMYSLNRTPSSGIKGFLETPRYSSGYASLYGCFSFISEAHMFKSFETRVLATHQLLWALYQFCVTNRKEILAIRREVREGLKVKESYALDWELDSSRAEVIELELYQEVYEESAVTGHQRLRYERNSSLSAVPYYPYYEAFVTVQAPKYYVIPQAWKEVIDRMRWNGVEMYRLDRDVNLPVQVSYISGYQTSRSPYEGHYLHYDVETIEQEQNWNYFEGDYIVPVDQLANRLIVEGLEPRSVDSYFAWGFFDGILQQKEWFSDYIFEDTALQWLITHPEQRSEFEKLKAEDPDFAASHFRQLYWIYQRSPNFENTYNRYPIGRIFKELKMPISPEQ
jgi:hypothetical protein